MKVITFEMRTFQKCPISLKDSFSYFYASALKNAGRMRKGQKFSYRDYWRK
jgi:hypothetical protein